MKLNKINPKYFCDGCCKEVNTNGPYLAEKGEWSELHYHNYECRNKYYNEVKNNPLKCVPAAIAQISQYDTFTGDYVFMNQEDFMNIVENF